MSAHGQSVGSRRGGRWAQFVRRYGWRAYALPVLSAVTVVALLHPTTSAHRSVMAGAASTGASGSAGAAPPATSGPSSRGLQVEGFNGGDAGFQAASTPAPVVINLRGDATSCATNTYRHLVLVSVSRQHLWACEGGKQVADTAVTTGATVDNDQTPFGSWRVQAKQRDRYLVGPGYKDYVHYWVPFNGDFGLHDAPWQTMPFGSKNWKTQGSHGCVHVPSTTMAWLYRWVGVGDTVVTVEN